MIALLLGGSVLFFIMLLCWKYKDKLFAENGTTKIWFVLAAALLLRLILAGTVKGFGVDINCFTAWGDMAFEQGIPHMYAYAFENQIFIDYPPGYMYILYLVGMLRSLFQMRPDSVAFLILLKLPATVFDLMTAFLIWRIAQKKGKETLGLVLAAAWALHPAMITTASLWGQVDGIFIFLLLLAFYWLTEKRHIASTIVYALALLVKPQALVFFPIYIWYIVDLFLKREKGAALLVLKCFGAGLGVFVLGVLPFSVGQEWNWIFKLYTSTLSSYNYASLNTFNLFAAVGGNFVDLDQTLLGIPYQIWGIALMAAAVLSSAWVYHKRGVLTAAAYLNIGLYLLGTKMHERYILPSLALLLLAYLLENKAPLRHFFAVFSFTAFLNVAYVLFMALQEPAVYNLPVNDIFMIVISIVNLAAFVLMTYYCFGGKRFETTIKDQT